MTHVNVAARFLLGTSQVTPKKALAIVQEYTRKGLLSGVPGEIRHHYLEMAEKIRPLASVLDGVVVQRADEARKLKNIRDWLKVVERATDPKRIEGVPDDELDIALPMRLDSLTDALKSLVRVESRLTEYSNVEKVIPHGKYQIINKHGYRPDEYAAPLKILDSASEVITRAGFGQAVYGEVVLISDKGARSAGRYYIGGDKIQLNMGARHRDGTAVYSLVHELGHRVWFKFLSESQREAYEDMYYGTAPLSFTLKDRELFWNAWENANWSELGAKASLPQDKQMGFLEYLADFKQHNALPGMKGLGITIEMIKKQFVRAKSRYYVIDHRSLSSVTDYGQTSVEEDFAEVFAHHCFNQKLPIDARERFARATGI